MEGFEKGLDLRAKIKNQEGEGPGSRSGLGRGWVLGVYSTHDRAMRGNFRRPGEIGGTVLLRTVTVG